MFSVDEISLFVPSPFLKSCAVRETTLHSFFALRGMYVSRGRGSYHPSIIDRKKLWMKYKSTRFEFASFSSSTLRIDMNRLLC